MQAHDAFLGTHLQSSGALSVTGYLQEEMKVAAVKPGLKIVLVHKEWKEIHLGLLTMDCGSLGQAYCM